MGFGSYDESEQGSQEVSTDEGESVKVHDSEFEGDVDFESAPTDELVDQLGDIKADAEEE